MEKHESEQICLKPQAFGKRVGGNRKVGKFEPIKGDGNNDSVGIPFWKPELGGVSAIFSFP